MIFVRITILNKEFNHNLKGDIKYAEINGKKRRKKVNKGFRLG